MLVLSTINMAEEKLKKPKVTGHPGPTRLKTVTFFSMSLLWLILVAILVGIVVFTISTQIEGDLSQGKFICFGHYFNCMYIVH